MLPALVAFGDLELSDAPAQITAIRTGTHKLIEPLNGRTSEEIYDLEADPGEHSRIASGSTAAEPPLLQELADWRAGWPDCRRSQAVALSAEHRELLRALGYMK
jgi:hypothetical protein